MAAEKKLKWIFLVICALKSGNMMNMKNPTTFTGYTVASGHLNPEYPPTVGFENKNGIVA
jgi:hypothetical protein